MLNKYERKLINRLAKKHGLSSIEEIKLQALVAHDHPPADIYSRLIYAIGQYFLESINWRKDEALKLAINLAAQYDIVTQLAAALERQRPQN